MSYKLYTDKPEQFECEISVKNASLKNSFARLVVESDDLSLVFHGKVNNGKCVVPIRKLKGLLDENTKGKIHLEVIVEDTYFRPWEEEFEVEEHTSVKVQVQEQKESSKKPVLEVKVKQDKKDSPSPIAEEIISVCKKFNINSENFKSKKRNDFKQLVKEYFKQNSDLKNKMNSILNEVVNNLS